MILVDTGPLVALLDIDDSNHSLCVRALTQLPPDDLLTTWPCLTEAMYLLGAVGGFRYQSKLWQLITNEELFLHNLSDSDLKRMKTLMDKYRDTPMDFADASLVSTAESLSLRKIFTLDSDFQIYRLSDKSAFEIVP
jgi:predicted nucleic acid-binding protein